MQIASTSKIFFLIIIKIKSNIFIDTDASKVGLGENNVNDDICLKFCFHPYLSNSAWEPCIFAVLILFYENYKAGIRYVKVLSTYNPPHNMQATTANGKKYLEHNLAVLNPAKFWSAEEFKIIDTFPQLFSGLLNYLLSLLTLDCS